MIGKKLGHYRIVEKIGEGGMGVVYRAYDEELHRDVAIKVLPQGALDDKSRKRFHREALTLAKLNHPNIEFVYEFSSYDGVDLLVLEYVSGSILADKIRGRALSEREVAQLGMQLAAALDEAHDRGIVHRDLKPRNIALTPKGQVKVLDFGLAKIICPKSDVSTADFLTGTTAVTGTLPYMSPEQLRGDEADARSDIYATGMVLYEMATGKHPFSGKTGSALINATLNILPPPPGRLKHNISSMLEAIILKCLEKAPENRYQSAKELLVDLRRLAMSPGATSSSSTESVHRLPPKPFRAASYAALGALMLVITALTLNVGGWRGRMFPRSILPPIRSLAVLPLTNLSTDPQQIYFADGVTGELINNLSKIRALRVISHSSVRRYEGTHRPLSEIARELRVDAVVEGAVQRSDGNVKISASLVDARVDRNLWGRSYEGNLSHVLSLQSEVAQAIATEVRVQLTPQESQSLAQNRTVNTQAFEAYLRGRYFWNKRTPEDLRRAVGEFKKAIDLDPTYPSAWAGLADGYSMLSDYDEQRPQDAMPQARATAKKALELDSSLGEPWATLAIVEWAYDWNASAAETDFQRAIALNPSYATAHQWYGMYLCNGARFDEGIAELERARTIDPLSLVIEVNTGRCRYYARDYNRAVEVLEALERREPDYWIVHAILGQTYLSMGQLEDSIRELERARSLSPDSTRNLGVLGDAYGRAGRRDDALALVRNLAVLSRKRYIPPIYIAMIYLGLGDRSQAMVFLEKAYKDRSNWMVLLKSDPEFDSLRSDGRFRELLNRITPLTQPSEESLQTQNVLDRDADARHVSLLDTARRRD